MDVITWLHRWLSRHPLKEPTDADPSRYTAQVMARIRAVEQPKPSLGRGRVAWLPGVLRPAVATMATVTVGAAVVLLLGRGDEARQGVTQRPTESHGQLMLAEEPLEDDQWLVETLQLLETFDEEFPEETWLEDSSDEDWLRALEQVDQELLTRS